MMEHRLLRWIFLCLLPLAVLSQLKANVGGSGADETVFDEANIDLVLYVDPVNGNDANDGSESAPFKTVSGSYSTLEAEYKNAGKGVKLILKPGRYHESVVWRNLTAINGNPLIIEAETPGTAIWEGSEPFTSWQPSTTYPGLYEHVWTYSWGLGSPSGGGQPYTLGELGRRREMVYVDNIAQQQFLSIADLRAAESGFFVDDSNQRIYLKTSEDPAQTVVEVTTLPDVIANYVGRLFSMDFANNVALRGITFRRAATDSFGRAVNFYGSNNILVEHCVFTENNWYGLEFTNSRYCTARNNRMDNNGCNGFNANGLRDSLLSGNTSNDNGWRSWGYGDYTGWVSAGVKIAVAHRITVEDHESRRNASTGLWLDYDIKDAIVRDSILSDNYSPAAHGIFIEYSLGPVLIKDTVMNNNEVSGLYNSACENVTIDGCEIIGNQDAPILLSHHSRSNLTDMEDPQVSILWTEVAHDNQMIMNTVMSHPGTIIDYLYGNNQDILDYYADTELQNVTFVSDSTYAFVGTLSGFNRDWNTIEPMFKESTNSELIVSNQAFFSYDYWLESQFPSGDIANLRDEDSDADGIANVLEYALGTNPQVQDDIHSIFDPRIHAENVEATFSRDSLAKEAHIVVESSTDLQMWTALAESKNGEPFAPLVDITLADDANAMDNQVTLSYEHDLSDGPIFYRLRVEPAQ